MLVLVGLVNLLETSGNQMVEECGAAREDKGERAAGQREELSLLGPALGIRSPRPFLFLLPALLLFLLNLPSPRLLDPLCLAPASFSALAGVQPSSYCGCRW